MKPTVYTVHAYRHGDRDCHSYSVGVYSKKHAALKAAQTESDYRGGKYECEVLEWALDSGIEGGHDDTKCKTVQALSVDKRAFRRLLFEVPAADNRAGGWSWYSVEPNENL